MVIYRHCVDYYVPSQNKWCRCGRYCYPGEGCRIVNYTIYPVNDNQGGVNNKNNNVYRPSVDYYYVPKHNKWCRCGRYCYPGEGCRIVNYTIYTANNDQGGLTTTIRLTSTASASTTTTIISTSTASVVNNNNNFSGSRSTC